MSTFHAVDMREGNPVTQIIRFSIPMLIGNIAQQLYNTVDSIIVGRFVGDNALAAVGSAGPILNLMIVLFIGISVGASIMVSQYFGAQKREELSKAIGCCITLTGAASLLIMVIGPLTAGPLLRLLNTPESIIAWCEEYLTIIFLGVLGGGYYNILSGVMRGLGDSASALMILRMKDIFELRLRHLMPGGRYFRTLIRLGLPSGVTQAIFSMSMIVVQSLTNSFGEMFIAANVIVMRIDGFVMMPAFSLGTAMTTFAGQNIGAGRMDRVEAGARNGTLAAMGISAVITVLILLFGRGLMGVFTTTPELIDLSFRMMKILAPGYIAMEVIQCLGGIMRGAGDTVTPMWISIINTILIRVPLAYGLVALSRTPAQPQGDCAMMFVSLLIAWVIGALLTFLLYRTGRWKKKASAVLEASDC